VKKRKRIINENTERDFKGLWIPKALLFNSRLSPREILIIAEIDSLNKNDEGCFASNEYLADFFGVSESTIVNILVKLRKLKIVKTISFDGRKRIIKINQYHFYPESRLTKKSEADSLKKVTPYYTTYNIESNSRDVETAKSCLRQRKKELKLSDGKSKNKRQKSFYYKMAKELYKKCAEKRMIRGKRPNLYNWADEIKKLKTDTAKWSRVEIKETMLFYLEHFGEQYMPFIICGKIFRTKFIQIRQQMEMKSNQTGIKNKKQKLIDGQPLYKYLDIAIEKEEPHEWIDAVTGWSWIIYPDGRYQWQTLKDMKKGLWNTCVLEIN
jgi:DNA-binding Lrp family transcriptional regulator